MGWLYTSTTGANKLGVQAEAETVYMSHHSNLRFLSLLALPHNLHLYYLHHYHTCTCHSHCTYRETIISGCGSLYLRNKLFYFKKALYKPLKNFENYK